MTGRIHSFETFGAADGPGVRYIVFMHGCPFRCAYCHNPDTWASPPAFEMSADDVLQQALRYRDYWGAEGGITLSGGEPMAQAKFCSELFEKAKALKITTCLDTAGGPYDKSNEDIKKLLALSDTVILDLKLFDPKAHRLLTGCDNERVLECARALSEIGKRLWIRRVLVPGVTDDPTDLIKTGEFIRSLKTVEKVEVLAYHTLGIAKWQKLALQYTLSSVSPPSAEEIARAEALLAGKAN